MTGNGVLEQEMTCLEDVLAAGPLTPKRARHLARQIADELHAAQKYGVTHADLKPANILILGAGKRERAVITGFGGAGSTDSEIYAFGQLMDALLPGHRLAVECMASDPTVRPRSFEIVLEELQDFSAHRTWIGSLLIAAATVSLFLYELTRAHTNI